MEGAEENRENVEHFRGMNGVSRNLMHKFMKRSHENEEREGEEDEEIELSLGLSMNGRFGVDPTRKKLRRSSSVSNVVVTDNSVGNGSNPHAREEASGSYAPLLRACSMPSETQEWSRREECQPVRSMEKLKNVKVVKENEKCSQDVGGNGLHADASGISNLQGLVKEATQDPTATASSSRPFPQEPVAERPAITAIDTVATDEESLRNALIDMPYVSTKAYGLNHNKIEGFLYRYKRGEEVKIVCVCHGMFLSPAEFVKHGGGGDVAYPLKHIVVNPFPLY